MSRQNYVTKKRKRQTPTEMNGVAAAAAAVVKDCVFFQL
jgi:hypothetical protein